MDTKARRRVPPGRSSTEHSSRRNHLRMSQNARVIFLLSCRFAGGSTRTTHSRLTPVAVPLPRSTFYCKQSRRGVGWIRRSRGVDVHGHALLLLTLRVYPPFRCVLLVSGGDEGRSTDAHRAHYPPSIGDDKILHGYLKARLGQKPAERGDVDRKALAGRFPLEEIVESGQTRRGDVQSWETARWCFSSAWSTP
eukprot:1185976-Prorocentrum_minimum.AAC.2